MNNVRVDRASRRIIFISPNCVEQTIATQCLHRIGDEVSEESKLFRREIDYASVATHFVAANVDFDVAEFIDLRSGGW